MSESKLERDSRRNARLGEIYVNASSQPWLCSRPGEEFKVLRVSPETGVWTLLLKYAAGTSVPRHEHLEAAEYYLISGSMDIRGGAERGGVSAKAGDYGYEAKGTIHDDTNFPEESIVYFTSYGALRFMDDDDQTLSVFDYKGVLEAAKGEFAA